MASIGSLVADLKLNSANFIRGFSRAEAMTKKQAASMRRHLRSVDMASRNVAKSFGKLRVSAQALGGALALGVAVKQFVEFDESIRKIVGLVGVAEEEVAGFRKEVLKLAPAVGKGPGELADALFFLTSAGLKGAKAMNALKIAGKASRAGLGETKTVADAMTSAMNAYATSNMTAAQAVDVLVATAREGKLEASELASSIGQVLAQTENAAISFSELGASIAALTRVGIKPAEAVSGIRAIITALGKESEKGAKFLDQYSLSFAGLRKEIRDKGLLVALTNLKEIVGGNETAFTKIFGRVEAATAVLTLTGANAEQVRGIFEALKNTTGALETAFAAIASGPGFKLTVAMARLQVVGIELGDVVMPSIARAVEFASKNFKTLLAAVSGIVAFKMATLFGGIAAAVWKYQKAVLAAAVATGALNAVMRVNPIGLVATAIGLAVAALIEFKDATIDIGSTTIDVGKTMSAVWATVVQSLRTTYLSIIGLAAAISNALVFRFDRSKEIFNNLLRINKEARDKIEKMWADIVIIPDTSGFESAVGRLGDPRKFAQTAAPSGIVSGTPVDTKHADAVKRVTEALKFQRDQLGRTATYQKIFTELQSAGISAADIIAGKYHLDAKAIAELVIEIDKMTAADKAAAKAKKDLARAQEEMADKIKSTVESLRTPQEAYNERIRELQEMYMNGLPAETFSRGIKKASEELEEAQDQTDKMAEAAQELGMSFASAFEDAMVAGKGLREILSGLEQDILRIMTRKLITEPFADALTAGLTGKPAATGNPFAFLTSGMASVFGVPAITGASATGSMGFPMMMAEGGNIGAGQLSIVGEEGPEWFVPKTAGAIIPNHVLVGNDNSPNVFNNNFNFPGGDADSFKRNEQQILNSLEEGMRRAAMRAGG